jgi:T6SS, Phospholipase effector Tle1-like, catalytic domain
MGSGGKALGSSSSITIESGRFGPRVRSHAFTKTNTSVEKVRYAVAIDEQRMMFNPQLWPLGSQFHSHPIAKADAKPQDGVKVWFNGAHGDVGGGVPENQSWLAKVALKVDDRTTQGPRAPLGHPNSQFHGPR